MRSSYGLSRTHATADLGPTPRSFHASELDFRLGAGLCEMLASPFAVSGLAIVAPHQAARFPDLSGRVTPIQEHLEGVRRGRDILPKSR